MPLSEMIAAARRREAERKRAIEEQRRAAEMQQFETAVHESFGEAFITDIGGALVYDGQPVINVSYEGTTYSLNLSRNHDGSRSWRIGERRVFDQGRIADEQARIDSVVLALADAAAPTLLDDTSPTTTETQRLDGIAAM